MQINVAIEKLSQTFFRQWLPRCSLVWSFWLLMFWWQWYWWYLTRTSLPAFLKLRLASWNLWFHGTVFENFMVSLGANKIQLFNEVWSKVDGFLFHLFNTSHFNKSETTNSHNKHFKTISFSQLYLVLNLITYNFYGFFFTFDDSHLYQIAKFCKRVYLFITKGHNIVLLLHWINVCSRFMLNTTAFFICLRFLVV